MTIEHIGDAVLYVGDVRDSLREIPADSVQCVVTSPPYWWLRDYGVAGQIGLESTPEEYVAALVDVFREVRRVLRDDGVLWLNLGDSYAGSWGAQGREGSMADRSIVSARQIAAHPHRESHTGSIAANSKLKPKDLVGIPWRVAFALQADGWWLRQDIIWSKPNPMPESVTDRCTKAHEYIFLLTKSARYFYDAEAVKEPDACTDHPRAVLDRPELTGGLMSPHNGIRRPEGRNGMGRNKRSVWTVATAPYSAAHFATFPPALIEPCVLAGSRPGDIVLDPFGGSGTTAGVALKHGRRAILCEISEEYAKLVPERIRSITDALDQPRLFDDPKGEPEQMTLIGGEP